MRPVAYVNSLTQQQAARARRLLRSGADLKVVAQMLGTTPAELDLGLWAWIGREA